MYAQGHVIYKARVITDMEYFHGYVHAVELVALS